MVADIGDKWPTLSDREFARRIRWSFRKDSSSHRGSRPRLLSPIGWYSVLGFIAAVIGAGLAFAT